MEILLCKIKIKWRLFKQRVLGIPLYRPLTIRQLNENEETFIDGEDLFIVEKDKQTTKLD